MSADALFPADAPTLVVSGTTSMRQGVVTDDTWVLRSCARCKAVVRLSDAREHARWHGEAT